MPRKVLAVLMCMALVYILGVYVHQAVASDVDQAIPVCGMSGTLYVDGVGLTPTTNPQHQLYALVLLAKKDIPLCGSYDETIPSVEYVMGSNPGIGDDYTLRMTTDNKIPCAFNSPIASGDPIMIELYLLGYPGTRYPVGIGSPSIFEDVACNGTRTVDLYATIPPGAPSNCQATPLGDGIIVLSWNAPGGDGDIGAAGAYEIKYSPNPINDSNYDSATEYPQTMEPKQHGEPETLQILGLYDPGNPTEDYYFAIKGVDPGDVYGPMCATTTGVVPPTPMPPYLANHSPAIGASVKYDLSNVGGLICVDVKDDGVGVDQSTIEMDVNGVSVNPSITSTTGGFTVCYNPPDFDVCQGTVTVTIRAADLAANSMEESYDFAISPLKANFTWSPDPSNEGQGVQFTDTTIWQCDGSSSPIVSHSWTFGDGGTSTAQNPLYTYADNPADTTYPVTLTVTNGDGLSDSITKDVTVQNVDPEIVAAGADPAEATECDTIVVTGSFTDAGILDTHTATIDWGEGDAPEAAEVTESQGSGSFTGSHSYTNDGNYNVTVTVTDKDGGEDSESFEVSIENSPPVLDQIPDAGITECNSLDVEVGFTDCGTGDVHTATIDWGEGASPEAATVTESEGSGTVTGSHQYADDDVYTVTVTLSDDDESVEQSFEVTVTNASPQLSSMDDVSADECDPTLNLEAPFIDCGTGDTHTATVDWGEGDGPEPATVIEEDGSGEVTGSHTYAGDGAFTVTVVVMDDDEGTDSGFFQLTIDNVAPEVAEVEDQQLDECDPSLNLEVPFTDCGTDDTHTATIDWGEGAGPVSATVTESEGSGTVTGSHTYADSGTYTVTIVVTDSDEDSGSKSLQVVVENVAPVVDELESQQVDECDAVVNVDASFSDCGTADTHTATIDWDEGAGPVSATVAESGGSGTVTGSHTYADSGIYTVTVVVTDDEDASDSKSFQVIVINAPPVIAELDDAEITECDALDVTASFTDCGALDTHTATIDWGEGGAPEDATVSESEGSGTVTGSHTYAGSGTYTVAVTVTDNDDDSDTESFLTVVTNVAPVLDDPADQQVDECNAVVNVAAGFTDCGTADAHTATIDWGEGAGPETAGVSESGGSGTVTGSNVYADSGTYTVTVVVTDDEEASDSETFTVIVDNVAPVIAHLEDREIDECDPTLPISVPFTDCGTLDTHTATIDWGEGSGPEAAMVEEAEGSGTVTGSNTYADSGTYTVTVVVTDDEEASDSESFTVTVTNAAPVVADLENQQVSECDPSVSVSASFTDCGTSDTHTATIDWGDGDEPEDAAVSETGGSGTVTGSHTYPDDDATYTVTVVVTDDEGASGSESFVVTVANADPVVDAGNDQTINEGGTPVVNATFTDCGTDDTHSATINWGSGPVSATVTEANGSGTVTGSHLYPDNCSNDVQVAVTDNDGGIGADNLMIVVNNLPPVVNAGPDVTISRSDPLDVLASFTDPGVLDTHTARINWGDGSPEEPVAVSESGGSGTLTGRHFYQQNDVFTVSVIVTDKDCGVGVDTLQVTVIGIEVLSATYDVLNTILTIEFDLPVNPNLICWDWIGMEVDDSGEWNFALSNATGLEARERRLTTTVNIDLNKATATTINMALAAIVKHYPVDLLLRVGAFRDDAGAENVEVTGADDVRIDMIAHGYSIGVLGDVSGNGVVTAYDAALMLKGIVNGFDTLPIADAAAEVDQWLEGATGGQGYDVLKAMADVDKSGTVTSLDAAYVLQKAAGLLAPSVATDARKCRLSVNNYDNGKLDVSIDLDDVKGVYAADIVMTYDPNTMTVADVSQAAGTSKWLFAEAADSGKLRISLAGASQPTEDGSLVTVSVDAASAEAIRQLEIVELRLNGGIAKVEVENIPKTFALMQNYPNPFNPETWLPYQLSLPSDVSISIYNINGQLVRRLELGNKMPGSYVDKSRAAYWDGRNESGEKVSSGIYFYQLQAGRDTSIGKMIIVK